MITDLLSKCDCLRLVWTKNIYSYAAVVSVPIKLLWKVKIRLQQKAVLCIFLCLSVFMFAISAVRTVQPTLRGNTGIAMDSQWETFWQQLEAYVAVMVVSLTSFRSLYGIKNLQREHKIQEQYHPRFLTHGWNLLSRRKQREANELDGTVAISNHALSTTPGRTMTGIRTVIHGFGNQTNVSMKDDDLLSVDKIERATDQPNVIKVVVDLDTRQSVKDYV